MFWFGKKEANRVIDGVGNFIDEQQLTKEEQIKYKLEWFAKMEPFKIVQRIIVSMIFSAWAFLLANVVIAIWVAHLTGNKSAMDALFGLMEHKYIWMPTVSAVTVYLSGGLPFFKKK